MISKCYYCVCTVCNMARCPHGHDKFEHCLRACHNQNKRIPILECDYFQHKQKTKVFKVKRKITPNKLYTSADIGHMLDVIMTKLGGDIAEMAREGVYEVYYCETLVNHFDTLLEAEQYRNENFKNMDIVKIKIKGE